jgi:hypothetical protein
MSVTRRLALKLLLAVLRYAPAESHEWTQAMLRELDFIESDWVALLWALGSSTAIVKHAGRGWLGGSRKRPELKEERTMMDFLRKLAGMLAGVAMAVVLTLCAYEVMRVSFHYFPSLESGRVPWAAWLIVFAIPETLFVVGIVKLWRRRRPMAVGILVTALIFVTHFVMHVASHWNGE